MKMLKGNWRIAAISNKVCTVYVRHREKMFLCAIGSTLKDCPKMKDHSFVNSVLWVKCYIYVPLLYLTKDFYAHIMKDTSNDLFLPNADLCTFTTH